VKLHRYSNGSWSFCFRWGVIDWWHYKELQSFSVQVHRFSLTLYRDQHTGMKWKLLKDFNARTVSLKWFSDGCPLTKQGVFVRTKVMREALERGDIARCIQMIDSIEALAENMKS
jgi:hypothetical protein